MKIPVCELCGGKKLIKKDGMFVCSDCGTQYSLEEARNMMVEVEDTPENVSLVTTKPEPAKNEQKDELKNLYEVARRARDNNDDEGAAKYYDMILVKDPMSWEAAFYTIYFKAMGCKIIGIASAANSVHNCIDTTLSLIKNHVADHDEQIKAYTEVASRVTIIANMLYAGAKSHYDGINSEIKNNYTNEFLGRAVSSFQCMYFLGDSLINLFGEDNAAQKLATAAWKNAINLHKTIVWMFAAKEANKNTIESYVKKIRVYDSFYTTPDITDSNPNGCYVATCVYGSYDCPEVWTLRRFRDDTLAASWYGRAFIRVYYAVSPTIVRIFGENKAFKAYWQRRLDKMVGKLRAEGVEDTPYNDKNW